MKRGGNINKILRNAKMHRDERSRHTLVDAARKRTSKATQEAALGNAAADQNQQLIRTKGIEIGSIVKFTSQASTYTVIEIKGDGRLILRGMEDLPVLPRKVTVVQKQK